MNNLSQLKNSFVNKELIEQALTHRSWLNENNNLRKSNERLEFLGDAILEYVVSAELFNRFTEREEGYLTALRASLVNTENLAKLAVRLEIGEGLYLSKGEEDGGGRQNTSILADTIEAIIGAIYIDRGIEAASEFIYKEILTEVDEKISGPLKDAKSSLQEVVQSKGLETPRYEVVGEEGPDHDKVFRVNVLVGEEVWGTGAGKSKSLAEQEAAKKALTKNVTRDT